MQVPEHFDLLSELDKKTYMKLYEAIKSPVKTIHCKSSQKNREFQEILDALLLFINHDEYDKWKRSLVVGLFQFEGGIALNISSLRKILKRCKTSINQSFKDLGYQSVITRASLCRELLANIPILKDNSRELKHWTIRFKGDVPQIYIKEKPVASIIRESDHDSENQSSSNEQSTVEDISFDFSTSSFDPFEDLEEYIV